MCYKKKRKENEPVAKSRSSESKLAPREIDSEEESDAVLDLNE